MKTNVPFLLWRIELRHAMLATVKRLRAGGVVSMAEQNLWQCTRIPMSEGPSGANALWTAKNIFREIITSEPKLKTFVTL